MNTSTARVLSAVLAAHIAFGLAFLAAGLGRVPILLYAPLERHVILVSPAAKPPGLWMAWFGATLGALGAALAAGALAWVASGRAAVARSLLTARGTAALARAALLTMLVTYAYFGVTLLRQTPSPLPLPTWYCPR